MHVYAYYWMAISVWHDSDKADTEGYEYERFYVSIGMRKIIFAMDPEMFFNKTRNRHISKTRNVYASPKAHTVESNRVLFPKMTLCSAKIHCPLAHVISLDAERPGSLPDAIVFAERLPSPSHGIPS